jgi:hypothetical protein
MDSVRHREIGSGSLNCVSRGCSQARRRQDDATVSPVQEFARHASVWAGLCAWLGVQLLNSLTLRRPARQFTSGAQVLTDPAGGAARRGLSVQFSLRVDQVPGRGSRRGPTPPGRTPGRGRAAETLSQGLRIRDDPTSGLVSTGSHTDPDAGSITNVGTVITSPYPAGRCRVRRACCHA